MEEAADSRKAMEEKATKEENFHRKIFVEKVAVEKKAMEEKGFPKVTYPLVFTDEDNIEAETESPINNLSSSNLSHKRKAMEADLFPSPSSDDDVSQEHPMDDGFTSKQVQGTDTTPLKGPKTDESPESPDDESNPIDHLSSSNLSQKRKAMEANLFSSLSSDDESPKHQKDVSQEHPMDDGLSSKQIQGTDTTPLKGPKTDESPESPEPSEDDFNPIDLIPDFSEYEESSDDEWINEADLSSSNLCEPTVIGVRKAMDESQEHPKDGGSSSKQIQGTATTPLKGLKANESPESPVPSDDESNPIDHLSSSNRCEPTVMGVRKAMDESPGHPMDESPDPLIYRMSSYKVKMVTALRKLLLEQQAKREARANRLAIIEKQTIKEEVVEENEEEDDEESEEEKNVNYGTCDVCCKENVHWAYNCPYLTLIPYPTETKIGPRYDVTCKCHTRMGCHPDPNDKGWKGRAIKKYCANCRFPDHWYEDCPIRAEMLKKREQKKREQKKQEQLVEVSV